MKDHKLLMVTVTGRDRPGILAVFSSVLAQHRAEALDIEQASLQDLLGLYILIDPVEAEGSTDTLIKDLLFEASRLDLSLHFRLLPAEQVRLLSQRNLHVLTHFGDTRALAELASLLKEEEVNVELISTLSHHGSRSMEMILNVDSAPSLSRLKRRLMLKSRELGFDLALQKMEAYRKNKRLIFFDMDSTLIDMEIIDEMARRAGVFREVARITDKAMRGDFDFTESLVQRVALLKGLPEEQLMEIRDSMRLSEGVQELLTTLKWLGYRIGVVTGGFDFFAESLKQKLGLDYAYANRLEIRQGKLTGRVPGEVIDAAEKARIVNRTACELGVPLDQTVVVGDGANDALMLGQAGLSIAYNAKSRLAQVANASLGRSRLTNILHLLGITEEDIAEARSCLPPQS